MNNKEVIIAKNARIQYHQNNQPFHIRHKSIIGTFSLEKKN